MSGLNDNSQRLRFGGAMSSSRLLQYCAGATRDKNKMVLGACLLNKPDIVIGAAEIDFHEGTADIAFAVSDKFSKSGVGSRLMNSVIEVCILSGVHTITASVYPSNTRMLRMLTGLGFRTSGKLTDCELHFTLRLDDAAARAIVRRKFASSPPTYAPHPPLNSPRLSDSHRNCLRA